MRGKTNEISGHIMAFVCVLVWGSTFVVSKSLMACVQPVQLMLLRFLLAYGALWIMYPKWYVCWKEEWKFLVLAVFANTLYCWAENTALTLTQATNVSILVSTSPIVSALLLMLFYREERLNRKQGIGFAVAFTGVILVVFNGAVALKLNPVGDLLALVASTSWAVYCILLRLWSDGDDSLLITRKLMFYGILTVLPMVAMETTPIDYDGLLTWGNLLKLAYLGLVGSAGCYFLWNRAVTGIGVLKSNLYIYMIPLVTLMVSSIFLEESITAMGFAGILTVIAGMILGTI